MENSCFFICIRIMHHQLLYSPKLADNSKN